MRKLKIYNKFAENETVSENKDGGHTTRSGRVVTLQSKYQYF